MKKCILIGTLLFFFGVFSAEAQAFFTTEKAAFYDQLAAYLNTSSSKQDRDEAAVIMRDFKDVWNSYYDGQDAAMVMRLCELFHAKSGARAYANIFNFTEIVQKFPASGMTLKLKLQ